MNMSRNDKLRHTSAITDIWRLIEPVITLGWNLKYPGLMRSRAGSGQHFGLLLICIYLSTLPPNYDI